ncbi:hypothetical protein DQX05_03145 [Paenibacillus thiaminolyticus]|uniref:WYL domain-containing protein n=1 Tax=Paenibacillus thiaminolyticus TaxID=49283 RepID=A0A3A3GM16_PANTH|nr:hypothetical protein DQX05_03145 [Paenibacillus thiaminolyticus]
MFGVMGMRLDQCNDSISQRRIIVRRACDGVLHATCLTAGEWRPFRIERILSWQPVRGANGVS